MAMIIGLGQVTALTKGYPAGAPGHWETAHTAMATTARAAPGLPHTRRRTAGPRVTRVFRHGATDRPINRLFNSAAFHFSSRHICQNMSFSSSCRHIHSYLPHVCRCDRVVTCALPRCVAEAPLDLSRR